MVYELSNLESLDNGKTESKAYVLKIPDRFFTGSSENADQANGKTKQLAY